MAKVNHFAFTALSAVVLAACLVSVGSSPITQNAYAAEADQPQTQTVTLNYGERFDVAACLGIDGSAHWTQLTFSKRNIVTAAYYEDTEWSDARDLYGDSGIIKAVGFGTVTVRLTWCDVDADGNPVATVDEGGNLLDSKGKPLGGVDAEGNAVEDIHSARVIVTVPSTCSYGVKKCDKVYVGTKYTMRALFGAACDQGGHFVRGTGYVVLSGGQKIKFTRSGARTVKYKVGKRVYKLKLAAVHSKTSVKNAVLARVRSEVAAQGIAVTSKSVRAVSYAKCGFAVEDPAVLADAGYQLSDAAWEDVARYGYEVSGIEVCLKVKGLDGALHETFAFGWYHDGQLCYWWPRENMDW